ncbi:hypothetical protein METP2_01415 [Methanosarcinales archaeon]|nr:hypothetical protein METP2_01415 [Methanosarcinales archaeon]
MNLKKVILLPFIIVIGLIAIFFFLMDDIVHLFKPRHKLKESINCICRKLYANLFFKKNVDF